MALRMADSASTANAIEAAGPVLRLGDQEIRLSGHVEASRPPDGTGVMVLRLETVAGDWPAGIQLGNLAVRPQSAQYYFTYIDLDRTGNPTRITSRNYLPPKVEINRSVMEVRFRILRLVDKPYEVQVSLLNAEGQIFRLGVRAIEQR